MWASASHRYRWNVVIGLGLCVWGLPATAFYVFELYPKAYPSSVFAHAVVWGIGAVLLVGASVLAGRKGTPGCAFVLKVCAIGAAGLAVLFGTWAATLALPLVWWGP